MLYWGGVHTAGGLVLRQMRDQGLGAVFMSGDGIASDEFAAIAGPGAEGTLMTFGPDPQKRPEAKEIIERFEAREYKPEAYTLYSYAAVQILKQAIEATKSVDPKTVAAYMRTGVEFNTVIGDIAFDEKGDIKQVGLRHVHVDEAAGRPHHLRAELTPSRRGHFRILIWGRGAKGDSDLPSEFVRTRRR